MNGAGVELEYSSLYRVGLYHSMTILRGSARRLGHWVFRSRCFHGHGALIPNVSSANLRAWSRTHTSFTSRIPSRTPSYAWSREVGFTSTRWRLHYGIKFKHTITCCSRAKLRHNLLHVARLGLNYWLRRQYQTPMHINLTSPFLPCVIRRISVMW